MSTTSGKCAVCTVEAKLKCTACKTTFYCGVQHQRQHWKLHKPLCCRRRVETSTAAAAAASSLSSSASSADAFYEIAVDATLGRHVVATRDIPARSVLFVEAPLVCGPKWTLEEFEKEVPVFPCVGCFRPLHVGRAEKCSRCRWPICGVKCAGLTDARRHGTECAVLARAKKALKKGGRSGGGGGSVQDALEFYRSDALLALRSVLLQRWAPEKWEQLLRLESHEAERMGTSYYEEADRRIVSYLLERIFTDPQPPAPHQFACDAATLHRICGIIEVNAMNVTLEHGQEIGAVYPTACMLEHSCQPNCMFTFELAGAYRITMLAGRDIRAGEHMSIMYTDMLWGTRARLEHLRATKYFVCRCARCTDPSELGTFLSALRCIGDVHETCSGTMLPLDAHDAHTDWRCDRCPVRLGSEHLGGLMASIEDEVDGVLLNKETTVAEVETLLAKLSRFLHPHHYHMFALKHSLVQLWGNRPGYETAGLTDAQLLGKVAMCEELLALVDVLDPHALRLALYIGIVLYELHGAVVELERRRQRRAKEAGQAYDDEAYDALYVAEGYLVRAKRVLANSGDTRQGRKLVESVVRASVALEQMFVR